MGSQEAGGQLLPETLPPLDAGYSKTNTQTLLCTLFPIKLIRPTDKKSFETCIFQCWAQRKHTEGQRCSWGLEVRSWARSLISQIRWLQLHNTNRANVKGREGGRATRTENCFGVLYGRKVSTGNFFFCKTQIKQMIAFYLCSLVPIAINSGVSDITVSLRRSTGVFLCQRTHPAGTGQPHHLLVCPSIH